MCFQSCDFFPETVQIEALCAFLEGREQLEMNNAIIECFRQEISRCVRTEPHML